MRTAADTYQDIQLERAAEAARITNAIHRQGTPEWMNVYRVTLDRLVREQLKARGTPVAVAEGSAYAEAARRTKLRGVRENSREWSATFAAQLAEVRQEITAGRKPTPAEQARIDAVFNQCAARLLRERAPKTTAPKAAAAPASNVAAFRSKEARQIADCATALREYFAAENRGDAARAKAVDRARSAVKGTHLAQIDFTKAAASLNEYRTAGNSFAASVAVWVGAKGDAIHEATGLSRGSLRATAITNAVDRAIGNGGGEAA